MNATNALRCGGLLAIPMLRRAAFTAVLNLCLTGAVVAEPSRALTPIYTGLVYPEGPIFDGPTLLFTDMKLGAVLQYDGHAVSRVWSDPSCGPTALAPLHGSEWLIACHLTHELAFLDLHDLAAPKQLARTPFRRPNDMYAGAHGVYVSRSGEFAASAPITGEVWLVKAASDQQQVARRIHYANGVAVTRDGKFLLVDEHLEHRVWRYPINPDGTLGERTLAFDVESVIGDRASPLDGPDGIEPARDGSFYVAIYGRGMILHVAAGGTLIERFTANGYPKLTNMALTPDESGLYAVSSMADEQAGALFYVDLKAH